jgi:NAD-dependent SIR2 family protein deacetylase
MESSQTDAALERAAEAIKTADALVIGSGAGMGVDSGLPDFRGNEGFWNAYPPFRERKLSFVDLANPIWFQSDPEQAWGFYGHRLQLYRATRPHEGFQCLLRWAEAKPAGYFVFTSNVDGQFQQAGFDPDHIVECHGSIHHLQCTALCSDEIWSGDDVLVDVDANTFRAGPPLPKCQRCGQMARPNVLMFGDHDWLEHRTGRQWQTYEAWLQGLAGWKLATIECGAGMAIPTVRHHCQRLPGTLIRINPREADVPPSAIRIPLGASDALGRLARLLGEWPASQPPSATP